MRLQGKVALVTGANTARQLIFRPRLALDPYATGIPGVYLCSAATPPGAGAHGMCGYNAANSALRAVRPEAPTTTIRAVLESPISRCAGESGSMTVSTVRALSTVCAFATSAGGITDSTSFA